MNGLWAPLAEVAAILLAAGAIGYLLAADFAPSSWERAERAGWGFALGLTLLAVSVPIAFLAQLPPRWMAFLVLALALAFSLWRRRRTRGGVPSVTNPRSKTCPPELQRRRIQNPRFVFLLLFLIAFGVAVFALRALTEPMWSNDYLAIWGFKGKVIFGAGGVPRRLFTDPNLVFSRQEYPLGLPFLYASLAFLLGRWDDHATALLFPFLQAATLLALAGWLRRRGASRVAALGSAGLLAQFEPLYSAFHTGLAEIPLSFVILLFGESLVDVLDRTDTRAALRLALTSVLAVSTKNEGVMLVAAGALICLLSGRKARSGFPRVLAAAVAPAVVLVVIGRLWKGPLPFAAFEFGYLGPPLVYELLPRVREAVHAALFEVILPAWPGLLSVAVLVAAGRGSPAGNRLLVLGLVCAAVYMLLPSLAVLGPEWMIRTSFARTTSALAPLAAAGIALRFGSGESEAMSS
jgi:hypothetical protein